MKTCLPINNRKIRWSNSFLRTILNEDVYEKESSKNDVKICDTAFSGVFRSYNEFAPPNHDVSPTPTLSSKIARWQTELALEQEHNQQQQYQCSCNIVHDRDNISSSSSRHRDQQQRSRRSSEREKCEFCNESGLFGETLSSKSFETGNSQNYKQGGGFGGLNGSPSPSTPMGSTSRLVTDNQKNKESWKCFPRITTAFVTLCLTASLGNLLRLPRVVYLHGAGTFLVAYIIVNLILGIPLVFLEIVLGQFCQQGTTKLWRAVPLFRGVGFVKVLVSALLAIYYVIIMALSLFYAVWSAKGPIPFAECPMKYISSKFVAVVGADRLTSGEECLKKTFLLSPSTDMLWFCVLVTFLLLLWAFLVLCLFRDVDSVRKSVLFVYPLIIIGLVALAYDTYLRDYKGVLNLLNINYESLLKLDIWYYAVIQFFFSTHVGFGNITTCAGRLYAKNNAFWTSIMFILMNIATGLAFVCIVYMWLSMLNKPSYSAETSQMEMPELFVVTLIYDTLSTYTNFGQLWATVAFVLLLLSGFVSSICLVYTVVTCVVVEGKRKRKWWTMTILVCLLGFVLSVLSILPGDLSIIHILEHYVIGRLVLITTMLELIGFIWVYGLENLSNDFEFVLGYKLNILWKSIWFIAPIILGVLEVYRMFFMTVAISPFRPWEGMAGWIVHGTAWGIILLVAIWQILSQVDFDISQKYRSSLKPTRNWGPVDPIYRHCWVQWKKQYQITGERDFTLRRRGTRDYTHSIKRGQHAGPVGAKYSINPPPSSQGYPNDQAPISYIYDEASTLNKSQNMFNTHLQSAIYSTPPSNNQNKPSTNHVYQPERMMDDNNMYHTERILDDNNMYTSTPNTHQYGNRPIVYSSRVPPNVYTTKVVYDNRRDGRATSHMYIENDNTYGAYGVGGGVQSHVSPYDEQTPDSLNYTSSYDDTNVIQNAYSPTRYGDGSTSASSQLYFISNEPDKEHVCWRKNQR